LPRRILSVGFPAIFPINSSCLAQPGRNFACLDGVAGEYLHVLIDEPIFCFMWSWFQPRSALLAVACAMVCTAPAFGQLSPRLKRCLPYPTFADEVRDAQREVDSKTSAATNTPKSRQRVVIDDVKFDGPIHLGDSMREQFVARLKTSTFDASSDPDTSYNWLDQVVAWIRGTWEDDGFFKVEPSAREEVIKSDASLEHVLLTIHVNEGLQYSLGDLSYRSADPTDPLVFSTEQLRSLLHMHEGDIFSAEKVRGAIEAMKQLYGSRGYIDFVVTPLTDIDDARGRISLIMEVDQEKQYRLEKIEVFSSNPTIETALRTKLHPGDVFNTQLIQDFLTENKSSLPTDVSMRDIELRRNVKSGTVDVRFNFQTCPQVQN
jgi:surface antigen-like variable number repeat protein